MKLRICQDLVMYVTFLLSLYPYHQMPCAPLVWMMGLHLLAFAFGADRKWWDNEWAGLYNERWDIGQTWWWVMVRAKGRRGTRDYSTKCACSWARDGIEGIRGTLNVVDDQCIGHLDGPSWARDGCDIVCCCGHILLFVLFKDYLLYFFSHRHPMQSSWLSSSWIENRLPLTDLRWWLPWRGGSM